MLYWNSQGMRRLIVLGMVILGSALGSLQNAQGAKKNQAAANLTTAYSSNSVAQAGSITVFAPGSTVSGGIWTAVSLDISTGALNGSTSTSSGVLALASVGTNSATTNSTVDPLGTLKATFNYSISRLILDAVRHRIYASDNANNRVLVFDTITNTLLTSILVGSAPYGLAMTPDSSTLYVANTGSTTKAFSIVDLTTLTVIGTLAAPSQPYNLVVGLGGRLYASTLNSNLPKIMQIDPADAANNTSISSSNSARLAISPDRKTLYIGDSNGALSKYNVSGVTAVLSQMATNTSYNNIDLQLSLDGSTLLFYNSNKLSATPTADLNALNGSYASSNQAAAAAFSQDGSQVYTAQSSYNGGITVFDASTYVPTASFTLPDYVYSYGPTALLAEESGRFLYVNTGTKLYIYATGRQAPSFTSNSIATVGGKGVSFSYQIQAEHFPTNYSTGTLPAGLSLSPSTGIIYGTPTQLGTFSVDITASNSLGTAQANLSIKIGIALQVTISGSGTVTPAYVGTSYPSVGQQVTITGIPGPDQQFIEWTGSIASTDNPLTFTMQEGYTLVANFAPLPPTITSPLKVAHSQGDSIGYNITSNHPATYTANGLPSGVQLNSSGYLYGTPANAAFSIDITATNASGSDTKTVQFLEAAYLNIYPDGGTITGLDTYNYLLIGQAYAVTAVPDYGYLFTGWTGSVMSIDATLNFVMGTDFSLQPQFRSRADLAGNYSGLIPGAQATTGATGLIKLHLDADGAFAGTAKIQGELTALSGRFANDSKASKTANGISFSFQITEFDGPVEIIGTSTLDGLSVSLALSRSTFSQQNTTNQTGTYALSLPAALPADGNVPPAASLKLKISRTGLIQFIGKLGDGTKIMATSRLADDDSFVIYLPLYGGKGLLSGVMTFQENSSDFVGTLTWVKPADLPAKFQKKYPDGFSTQIEATAVPQ